MVLWLLELPDYPLVLLVHLALELPDYPLVLWVLQVLEHLDPLYLLVALWHLVLLENL